ncbi:Protein cereblon, partial [Operophtera brumata]
LLLCRKCGADIADTNYIISKLSPGTTKTENRKLFGKQNLTVQTLVNPYGIQFEIVTLEKARCENVGHRCGQHLGWTFKRSHHAHKDSPSDQIHSFNGLILSNILGENCKTT